MSPFEHGEVFVLDDGGEVNFAISEVMHIVFSPVSDCPFLIVEFLS